ncbi:Barrier-to-autointegration factor [Aphelenchoides fujianensis]|nr:Barrier-to-autointegration factor [Aphelenchoides fujianensis]
MSTSKKHQDFVDAATIRNKEITDVPGVGPTYANRFQERGITKADQMLGQLLVVQKDEQKFANWTKETAGMRPGHSKAAYNSLNSWANQNM